MATTTYQVTLAVDGVTPVSVTERDQRLIGVFTR